MIVKQPLLLTANDGAFDIKINVHGGGESGQAGAVRHGITRALIDYDVGAQARPQPRRFRDARRARSRAQEGRPARRAPSQAVQQALSLRTGGRCRLPVSPARPFPAHPRGCPSARLRCWIALRSARVMGMVKAGDVIIDGPIEGNLSLLSRLNLSPEGASMNALAEPITPSTDEMPAPLDLHRQCRRQGAPSWSKRKATPS